MDRSAGFFGHLEQISAGMLAVSVRCERPVKAVRLVPQGEEIPFKAEEGRVAFTVGKIEGHHAGVAAGLIQARGPPNGALSDR